MHAITGHLFTEKPNIYPYLAYIFMHVNCFNYNVIKFYFQLLSIRHIASPYFFAYEMLTKFLTTGTPPLL